MWVCYDGSTPILDIIPEFIYQQDGTPPHFHHDVRGYLSDTLPHRWIGRASQDDSPLLLRSLDLTPCDIFLWGYVKDHVFVPPMPLDLAELRQRLSMQSLVLTIRCWYVYGRSWIIGSVSAESPTVDIWNTCKVCTETLRDALSSDTNLSSMSAMVTHLQTHEIPEGLLNCPVHIYIYISSVFCPRAGPSLQTQAPRLQFCPKCRSSIAQTQEPRLQFY